jgi:hypothetical protein
LVYTLKQPGTQFVIKGYTGTQFVSSLFIMLILREHLKGRVHARQGSSGGKRCVTATGPRRKNDRWYRHDANRLHEQRFPTLLTGLRVFVFHLLYLHLLFFFYICSPVYPFFRRTFTDGSRVVFAKTGVQRQTRCVNEDLQRPTAQQRLSESIRFSRRCKWKHLAYTWNIKRFASSTSYYYNLLILLV